MEVFESDPGILFKEPSKLCARNGEEGRTSSKREIKLTTNLTQHISKLGFSFSREAQSCNMKGNDALRMKGGASVCLARGGGLKPKRMSKWLSDGGDNTCDWNTYTSELTNKTVIIKTFLFSYPPVRPFVYKQSSSSLSWKRRTFLSL